VNSEVSALTELVRLLDGTRSLEVACGELVLREFDASEISRAVETLLELELLTYVSGREGTTHSAHGKFSLRGQTAFFAAACSVGGRLAWQDGVDAQREIEQAKVVLVGEGSTTHAVSTYLSDAGVGSLVCLPTGSAGTATDEHQAIERDREMSGQPPGARDVDFGGSQGLENLRTQIEPDEVDVVVFCSESFDTPSATSINAICLETGTPFLALQKRTLAVEIGPLVIPQETACYNCYLLRRRGAIGVDSADLSLDERVKGRLPWPIGAEWLSLEILRIISGLEPATKSRLWRFNLLNGESHSSPVLKLPRCQECGVHRRSPPRRLWDE
jgi:bacteriocin biosynthesis cyclodehydratase domain-containing protein